MTYSAWRIQFQSSEQAAKAAYAELQELKFTAHPDTVNCGNCGLVYNHTSKPDRCPHCECKLVYLKGSK